MAVSVSTQARRSAETTPIPNYVGGEWVRAFYGDLKAQGRDAIEFYTDKRVVISRW
ncbi:MAG: hypothetical protein HY704_00825 [Gemmatimonadetes bacterium]|nr:hypothetical protein [Gemmatimonadota bacterium]